MQEKISKKIEQYMFRMSQDFEKIHDFCVIVAYVCHIQKVDSWNFKLLKNTYFKYLNQKLINEPEFQGEALWTFAEGYCTCLLDSKLSEDDVKMLTAEGLQHLEQNADYIYSIYKSYVINELQNLDSDYINYYCTEIFYFINGKIKNKEIAYQFILEELEAASYGNNEALSFVKRNKFYNNEFKGTMKQSSIEVDGVNGPQQSLSRLIMGLPISNQIKAKMRIIVVQEIIDFWSSCDDIRVDLRTLI